jgi:hypothetical protein
MLELMDLTLAEQGCWITAGDIWGWEWNW